MSETQLFLSFGQTLGIKYRTHVTQVIYFAKCHGCVKLMLLQGYILPEPFDRVQLRTIRG